MIKEIQAKTLRDRQRAYYYARLDHHFPGLRARYEKAFGERYSAPAQNQARLWKSFTEACRKYRIPTKMPVFVPQNRLRKDAHQMKLFYCFLHKFLNLLLSNYSQMTGFWFRYLRSTL
jgi:hypothetical protein